MQENPNSIFLSAGLCWHRSTHNFTAGIVRRLFRHDESKPAGCVVLGESDMDKIHRMNYGNKHNHLSGIPATARAW
jgi:hypothetical protein